MPFLLYGARIASISKHDYAKMKTIMMIGFAQTENEMTVMGMTEYIEKWSIVNRLIDIENEFQQYKPFNGFEHAMYRKICEAEIAIGKTQAVNAVPVSELEKLRDYLYAEDLIFMRGLAELNKLIANYGAKKDEEVSK